MITEQSPFQYLSLNKIAPSPTNKRRIRQDKLQELADNIKAHGVMQPILVRPIGKDGRAMFNAGEDAAPDHYEIVAGERRWRASQLADQVNIPAMVREMVDLDALQLQVFENLHRDDLHPMEEAEAFDQLLKRSQDLIGLTVDELALKVGKSRSYVYASLKMLDLCTYARDAFFDGKIGKETAVLIARIPGEKLQKDAVKEITKPNWQGDGMSFRAAASHIRERFTLNLEKAPFDLHSTTLCAEAGSCLSCPKRSGNYPELFADIESADVCTDPNCFATKKIAHIEILKASGKLVITGKEAKEIAPHGVDSYFQGTYCKATRMPNIRGLEGSYADLLGDDLPAPIIVIDDKNNTAEVFEEPVLRQKLQEKIDAGELVIAEAQPREPSEWEIKRQQKEAAQQRESDRRREIFNSLNTALNAGISSDQQNYLLRLTLTFLFEMHMSADDTALVQAAFGHSGEGDFMQEFMQSPQSPDDLFKLLALSLAAGGISTGWGWEGPEDSEEDDEYKQFTLIAREFGIDPDSFSTPETASPPPSAAQATEQPAATEPAAPAGDVQASELTPPAAPADEELPPEFAEIRAKAQAKKARRQGKKESATADGDHMASTANAAEETSAPAKTTIAQRKAAAGWITNDARIKLTHEGKLRPGHIDGEKCGCCSQYNGNDRCTQHDIPTGYNAYCKSFESTSTEAAA